MRILAAYALLLGPFVLYLIGYVIAKLVIRARRSRTAVVAPVAAPAFDAAAFDPAASARPESTAAPGGAAVAAPAPKTGLRFHDSLACFAVAMIVLLTAGSVMQSLWGMWGLIGSELLLLIVPLVWALASRTPLREAFALRGLPISKLLGAAILWFGALMGIALANNLLIALVPELFVTVEALNEFMYAGAPLLAFFGVAIVPAICEEGLHRGLILYGGRYFKNKTVLVIVMGLVFGLFHMDPARFVSTALLGMAFSYAAIETRSIIAPVVMHFLNNLYAWGVPLLLQGAADDTAQQSAALPDIAVRLSMIVSYGILLVITVAGVTVGKLLLGGAGRRVMSKPLVIVIAAAVLVTAALGVMTLVAPADNTLFETSATFGELTSASDESFTVSEQGTISVSLDLKVEAGMLECYILDPAGETLFSARGSAFNTVEEFEVAPGEYRYGVRTVAPDGSLAPATGGYYSFSASFASANE